MRIFVLALALASCARNPTPSGNNNLAAGGGGSGGSGGGGAADLAVATGDMVHPLAGISCGNKQCGASAQYCCTADKGNSGVCNATNDFNCASVYFFCDGPEDCPPALGECCVVNGNASCGTPGNCAQMNGSLMCHKVADCAPGQSCCSAPKSPYALCLAQCP